MFGTIIAAVGNGLKALAIGLGWLKQNSDQNIGKQLQAAADDQASLKEDANAQKIDAAVSAESRTQLIDELRGPTAI